MEQNNTYKYISIVLAIIVIILGWKMYMSDESVSDGLDTMKESLTDCREELVAWQAEFTGNSDSAEARAELESVLEMCSDEVGEPTE